MKVNYVIIFVSDMDRSVSFYRDVVGLPLKFASPGWSEFTTEGATLALHMTEPGPPGSGESLPQPAGTCRPGLRVSDLDEFHQKMGAREVACVQEPETVFGSRVAQYRDPDGLVISVGEGPDGN